MVGEPGSNHYGGGVHPTPGPNSSRKFHLLTRMQREEREEQRREYREKMKEREERVQREERGGE